MLIEILRARPAETCFVWFLKKQPLRSACCSQILKEKPGLSVVWNHIYLKKKKSIVVHPFRCWWKGYNRIVQTAIDRKVDTEIDLYVLWTFKKCTWPTRFKSRVSACRCFCMPSDLPPARFCSVHKSSPSSQHIRCHSLTQSPKWWTWGNTSGKTHNMPFSVRLRPLQRRERKCNNRFRQHQAFLHLSEMCRFCCKDVFIVNEMRGELHSMCRESRDFAH